MLIPAPLSVRERGFSLHAATRAGAEDTQGRERLLQYVLRPPIATERVLAAPDGRVRLSLKKPFSDGTVAIDLDPLSLLCRLAATVPKPRLHTVRYRGGVLVAREVATARRAQARAGVMEKGVVYHPETGTPQGGVISPLLANVYLHDALDLWFEREVKPRLRGKATLIRYAMTSWSSSNRRQMLANSQTSFRNDSRSTVCGSTRRRHDWSISDRRDAAARRRDRRRKLRLARLHAVLGPVLERQMGGEEADSEGPLQAHAAPHLGVV